MLLLTDMLGATPSNIATRLLAPGRIEAVVMIDLLVVVVEVVEAKLVTLVAIEVVVPVADKVELDAVALDHKLMEVKPNVNAEKS